MAGHSRIEASFSSIQHTSFKSNMGKNNSKLKPEEIINLVDSTKSRFTTTEIINWHKTFNKNFPDNKMSLSGLMKIYEEIFPNGDASAFAQHMFRRFDLNGDGAIDFKEFLIILSITSRGDMHEKLRWAFHLYDVNNDGYVTKDEMIEILACIDKTGSDISMINDKMTPKERTEKIFDKMDMNKDGKLSIKEFVDGIIRYPRLLGANPLPVMK